MSVYRSTLGTDWTTLAREEVLDRAFALGVAAACGHHHPEEYERLKSAVDGAYDRSMVELAYSEGKQKANKMRRAAGDTESIWQTLVEDEDGSDLTDSIDRTRPPSRFDLPASLTRLSLLDKQHPDQRQSLDLPSFLRRE